MLAPQMAPMQAYAASFGSDPTAPVVPTAASAVIPPLEADQIPANAPRTLAAFLVSYEVEPLGQFWPLQQGGAVVGRKDAGTGAEIEIDHPTTSSRHAKVYAAARPGRVKIEDLGSTNGTYVNERRLDPGERRSVVHGDSVRFGGFTATIILL
jgi:pSer/pThr/pTyr-binding forkhead associated (FHA) protein